MSDKQIADTNIASVVSYIYSTFDLSVPCFAFLKSKHAVEIIESPVFAEKIQHIMISYQWDVQPTVLQIRDRLKAAGYRVWIDVEQMSMYIYIHHHMLLLLVLSGLCFVRIFINVTS